MIQLLAVAFFASLLVALAVILEQMVRAHWTEIVSALKAEGIRPERPAARPRPARRAVA